MTPVATRITQKCLTTTRGRPLLIPQQNRKPHRNLLCVSRRPLLKPTASRTLYRAHCTEQNYQPRQFKNTVEISIQMKDEHSYCNTSTSIKRMTKVIRKGIEGLVLMIKSAKNCLSQMIAPAAFQENNS